MDNKPTAKKSAENLAIIERWRWHGVVAFGLAAWLIASPPPEHWIPAIVSALVVAAVIVREISRKR